jgi:disulfide bond formation protein DsbB
LAEINVTSTPITRLSDPVPRAAIAVVLVGAATILGAWGFEAYGYVPCPLCLQERIPYYVGVPLAFVALVAARVRPLSAASRVLIGLVGVIFLAGAALAAYHSGVEWHWWPGPADCSTGAGSATSAGSLLDSLNTTILVRCDEAAWRLLGVSLAGWNFVISIALAAVSLHAAALRRRSGAARLL